MTPMRAIRLRLGVTQIAVADGVGCSRTRIVRYEQGEEMPPETARRLIAYAQSLGLALQMNHVYGGERLPEMPRRVAV